MISAHAVKGEIFAIIMQSEYLLILAFLAMDRVEIITRISGGNVVVNFVRDHLLSMFIKKLDVLW